MREMVWSEAPLEALSNSTIGLWYVRRGRKKSRVRAQHTHTLSISLYRSLSISLTQNINNPATTISNYSEENNNNKTEAKYRFAVDFPPRIFEAGMNAASYSLNLGVSRDGWGRRMCECDRQGQDIVSGTYHTWSNGNTQYILTLPIATAIVPSSGACIIRWLWRGFFLWANMFMARRQTVQATVEKKPPMLYKYSKCGACKFELEFHGEFFNFIDILYSLVRVRVHEIDPASATPIDIENFIRWY